MSLAQCDAMISLVDTEYYERSWCCMEVIMLLTIQEAYGVHLWYEHVINPVDGEEVLRPGSKDITISMAHTKVTIESDRPKLLFLDRQTRLLGWL
jgi:hypothetical protein